MRDHRLPGGRSAVLRFWAGAALLAAAPVQAQPVFELRQLAPDIHAAIVVANPSAYAFANSLIVVGGNGVLVVDTQQSLTAARSLIDEIRRLTDRPVRWVVNTHWHGDHVNGNQEYVQAFPGVEFIAHPSVPDDVATLGAARRTEELQQLPAAIRERERWLAEGTGPDGLPLNEDSRRTIERSARLRRSYLEDLQRTRFIGPAHTVIDSLDIRVGRHVVRIVHPGPAHTRGDLIVLIEDAGIAAVGDLLEFGMPYFDDAYPAGWSRAVLRIAALPAKILLPAHGAVVSDGSLVSDMRALLAHIELTAHCRARLPDAEKRHCDTAPASAELEELWSRQYQVSPAAFRTAFDSAVVRALLEQASR